MLRECSWQQVGQSRAGLEGEVLDIKESDYI